MNIKQKMIYVKFYDHTHIFFDAAIALEELKKEPFITIETVGFLLDEDDKYLRVIQDLENHPMMGTTMVKKAFFIFKKAIIERKVVK